MSTEDSIPSTVNRAGELLSSFVDEMHEGFQIIDFQWRYLFVNAVVAKQGKKTKEELLGRTMMECYPGIENTPLFVQMKKCMDERESVNFENEFAFPDGSTGWFGLLIRPCEEGIFILSVDITERKRAEENLQNKTGELNIMLGVATEWEEKMVKLRQTIVDLEQLVPNTFSPFV